MANMKMVEKEIQRAEIALGNSTDGEIASLLDSIGMDEATINVGRDLLAKVEELIANQVKEYGEQYGATYTLNSLKEKAEKIHLRTLKLARIEFSDDVNYEKSLGLKGARSRALSQWINDATTFYGNLDSEAIDRMGRFRYTSETINSEKELILSLYDAAQNQKKEMGDAQRATENRDIAIDKLLRWMSEFYKIAEIALDDEPQLCEKLGILDRY